MRNYPIIDLHCDLLLYLAGGVARTPFDPEVRCSIPQMRSGGVKTQVMAVFSETSSISSSEGRKQMDIFRMLPERYPESFRFLKRPEQVDDFADDRPISIILAIENASCICGEGDDLRASLEAFTALQKKIGKALYISLTWNGENRFGGGAFTKIGLKEDGKKVVDYLGDRGIALDLSHASDYLAFDLLTYIDKEKLPLAVIASHSNMRAVANYPRNLPDDLAKEIIARKGVIGINFIRYLLGRESPHSIARHIGHLLSLGGGASVCFGADFFYNGDVAMAHRKPVEELFFPEFDNAGGYPAVVKLVKEQLELMEGSLDNLCYKNAATLLKFLRS